MPTVAYMSVTGKAQGLITAGANTLESLGNKYQEGHTDESTVLEFKHEIVVPTDVLNGQPTGERMHRPAVIRKRYDKASPLLYNAVCSGETLTNVTIKWWRTAGEGKLEHFFTHVLHDAILVNMKADMVHTADPTRAHYDHEEILEMTYRQIDWSHEIAGTSGSDSWRTRPA